MSCKVHDFCNDCDSEKAFIFMTGLIMPFFGYGIYRLVTFLIEHIRWVS